MGSETRGLRSLADMIHVLSRPEGLNELVEIAAEHACQALGAATVSISRMQDEHDVVRTLINVGELGPSEERWPEHEIYPISGDMQLMTSIRKQRSMVSSIADPDCDPFQRVLLRRLGKGSSLTMPIEVDGAVWGEFWATRGVGCPVMDEDAIAYAEVLVAILASALSRVQRETDLATLAFHDPLTGLFNRRALDDHVAEVFAVAGDTARTVTIVAVDIDGLKVVNDSEGHASGDRQILQVATALSQTFDGLAPSAVARVGGDEFTVMVADQPVESVVEAINGVCEEVLAASPAVSLSAGVATAEIEAGTPMTPSLLFAAADRAQYVAKRSHSAVAVVSQEFSA